MAAQVEHPIKGVTSYIYRWGNDHTFGKETGDECTLYWQHDAQWIEEGLLGAGNILGSNNGQRQTMDGEIWWRIMI